MTTLQSIDPLESEARVRSDFVRELVQSSVDSPVLLSEYLSPPPKIIVQFWDDLTKLPSDVRECMESWKQLEPFGFEVQVFDERAARQFIKEHLGSRHEVAFEKCYHPSMKSDYFRYSYIFSKGGFYIDADDVYLGGSVDQLFADGRLKLQPFCYDIATSQMISPSNFLNERRDLLSYIFYFNTTPMIAGRNHPVVARALQNCTKALEEEFVNGLPEVQATTGPGNLTKSVCEVIQESGSQDSLLVVPDWEKLSTSKWPLSYRDDERNWRLSNQRAYRPRSPEKSL